MLRSSSPLHPRCAMGVTGWGRGIGSHKRFMKNKNRALRNGGRLRGRWPRGRRRRGADGRQPRCLAGNHPGAPRAEYGVHARPRWPCLPARTWPAPPRTASPCRCPGSVGVRAAARLSAVTPRARFQPAGGPGGALSLGRVRTAASAGARGRRGPCFGALGAPSARARGRRAVLAGWKIRVWCVFGRGHARRVRRAHAVRALTDLVHRTRGACWRGAHGSLCGD